MHLDHPYVPLIRGMSSLETPIIPKHIYEGTDFRNNPAVNAPIGTGPYRFVEWEKGSHITLERNPDYWRDGQPYLDQLIFRFIADAATRAAGIESGEIDVATFGTINPVEMRRLEKVDGISIAFGGYEAIAPVMLLELNTARPPFDKKEVRQAVAYALDRQRIIDTVWYGFGKPAVGPISSFVKGAGAWTDEGVRDFTVPDRLEIAGKLLDEAGYPMKDGKRFTFIHDAAAFGEDWRRMGEVIKQQLGKIGIEVELRNRDYPTFVRAVHNEYDFDMTSSWYIGMADPTLGVQRNTWSKMINKDVPFGNSSQYSNPEVDALWEAAQTEADPAKRNDYFHQLQRILVEDSPLIWIMDMDLVAVQRDRVKDLITSPFGVRGGLYDVWVQD
jgi:peptide/nickel transport system substrate-binding protein